MAWVSGANPGQNTAILYLNSSSGAAGSAIINLRRVAHTGMTQDAVDITHFDSTTSWREYTPGLKDAGSLTGEGNYMPQNSTHSSAAATGVLYRFLEATGDAAALVEWTIVWPDAALTTIYGDGILTSWESEIEVGGFLSFRFEVKLTGVPAWGTNA